jgi:surface protein
MTDVLSPPFSNDLVYGDSVENNLPHEDLPNVSSAVASSPDSNDSNWSTPTGKEFRSSFLFQSSCYLPDDDGTESESSYTDHTVHIGPLHRHEQYPNQSPSYGLDAAVTSILKPSDSIPSITSLQRRVMFSDDDRILQANTPDNPPNHRSENDDENDEEEKSSWLGYRISVPLHHEFHSLPMIPSITTSERMISNDEGIYSPPRGDGCDEEDWCNTVIGALSKTGISTVTYNDSRHHNSDGILTSFLFPQTKRRQRFCIVITLTVVVVCMTTAVTCGTMQCGRSSKSTTTSSYTEKESLSPSVAPSQRQSPANLSTVSTPTPTSSPTITPKVIIRSTEELYDAVDAYIFTRWNNSIDKNTDFDYVYNNVPIGQWDVSEITNFTSVFDVLRNPNVAMFNDDISSWDTSKAMTMQSMFYGAEKFNGNISTWQTHNVINMKEMFAQATIFDENISLWDVSKVTTMEGMCKYFQKRILFFGFLVSDDNDIHLPRLSFTSMIINIVRRASDFCGNLKQWNTSSVRIMSNMFLNCDSFNGVGVDTWDTSNVVDMSSMFRYAPYFNGDVSSWNVSRVVKMRGMFRQAVAFNSDISQWDVRRVTDMSQIVRL